MRTNPGRVLTLGLVSIGLATAVATTVETGRVAAVSVASEADLRLAFGDTDVSEITLDGDVTLTNCGEGALSRPGGATPLVVDGGGFTVEQTCPDERVIANDDGELEIRRLVVTGGSLDAGDLPAYGGGIYSVGPLVLIESSVLDNEAKGSLGGWGGGIASMSTLRVEASSVLRNTAGGGRSVFFGRGGGIYAEGATQVIDSLIAENTAEGAVGDGGRGGGIVINEQVEVRRSTVAGNTATGGSESGGGSFGGLVSNGGLTAVNTTVHGNSATGPGSSHGGVNAAGELVFVYSAITANGAETGSANVLFKPGDRSTSSVVAEARGGAPSCSGPVGSSGGFNFDEGTSCGFVDGTDLQGAGPPGLGPLGVEPNGGFVPVRLPASDSPLVDAIGVVDCFAGDASGVTTDQRGLERPQGEGCDIGPVELAEEPPPPTSPPTTAAPTTAAPTTAAPTTETPTTPPPTSTPPPTAPAPPPTDPPSSGITGNLPSTGSTVGVILLLGAGLIGVGLLARRLRVRRVG